MPDRLQLSRASTVVEHRMRCRSCLSVWLVIGRLPYLCPWCRSKNIGPSA